MIEKQPGESSYAYSAKKLTEITSKISVESLRESIVSSCEEFNQGHVFTLIQLGILVYFPSVALAIVYQQDQHEIDQDDEQITANCMDDMQPQQPDDMNIQMQQPQPQSQFINMVQRMIVEIMKQKQQQFMIEQQQQQQQKAAKRATKMMKGGKKENEEKKGDDEGRFSVRLEGGQKGGQKEVVWATVFIQI